MHLRSAPHPDISSRPPSSHSLFHIPAENPSSLPGSLGPAAYSDSAANPQDIPQTAKTPTSLAQARAFRLFRSPYDMFRKPPCRKRVVFRAPHSLSPRWPFSLHCGYKSPPAKSLHPSFPRRCLLPSPAASPFPQFRRECCGKSLRPSFRAVFALVSNPVHGRRLARLVRDKTRNSNGTAIRPASQLSHRRRMDFLPVHRCESHTPTPRTKLPAIALESLVSHSLWRLLCLPFGFRKLYHSA